MKQPARIARILLVAALSFATSCQTTGGDFLGLFPLPKFLSGSIEDGIYQPKDKSFKVWAPFSDATDSHDQYKWTWAEVSEIEYENEVLVRFAPIFEGLFTAGVIRSDKDIVSVNQAIAEDEAMLQMLFPGVPTKIIFSGKSSIRPEMGLIVFSFGSSKSQMGTAAIYFIVEGRRMGNLRITSRIYGTVESAAQALREEKNSTQRKFVRSFQFTNPE